MPLLMCFLIALGLIAPPYTAAATSAGGQPGELLIQKEQDMLTVKARQIPHRRILEGLASQLHFELIIAGPLEERNRVLMASLHRFRIFLIEFCAAQSRQLLLQRLMLCIERAR